MSRQSFPGFVLALLTPGVATSGAGSTPNLKCGGGLRSLCAMAGIHVFDKDHSRGVTVSVMPADVEPAPHMPRGVAAHVTLDGPVPDATRMPGRTEHGDHAGWTVRANGLARLWHDEVFAHARACGQPHRTYPFSCERGS